MHFPPLDYSPVTMSSSDQPEGRICSSLAALVVEIRLAAPGECPASYVARTSISGDGVAVPIFAGLGGNHTHFRAVYSVC